MTKSEKFHRQQLQKAAELSRIDPDKLNPIERERLRLDLWEFQMTIVGFGTHYEQAEGDTVPGIPDHYVTEMVEGLRDGFAKLMTLDAFPFRLRLNPKDVHFTAVVADRSMPPAVHTNLEMGRDSALYALFKHFEGSGIGIDRIRICP